MYVDNHAHLFKEYYDNIDLIIKKSCANNIGRIIVSGCNYESNLESMEMSNKYDIVYASIGFHPTELDNFKDKYFKFLEDNINNDKVVAIGEIGLDYHYENTNYDLQEYVFRRQLELALKYNKPVIIHSRDCIQKTYDILKEYKGIRGVIHSFGGTVEMAKLFINLGLYIGVGGIVTFKNAKNIKEVVESIDLSYILLETDSPYLSPEPYRGSINDSSNIPIIAESISKIKNIELKKVKDITSVNSCTLFDF